MVEIHVRVILNIKKSGTSLSIKRINKKKIENFHCTKEVMLANYFKNTLQGKLFHTFREFIILWKHISKLHQIYIPSKEHVLHFINRGKY